MKPSTMLFDSLSVISLLGKIKKLPESASPAELVDIAMECPAIQPQQITSEFLELAELAKKQQCKYLLEIGTYRGGTLFVFSQIAAANATVISVDFSTTLIGHFYCTLSAINIQSIVNIMNISDGNQRLITAAQ